MPETIDIYDANLVKIGKSERLQAHLEAKWHATFHLWVVLQPGEGAVLYQLRAPTAKNFPNMLDVSAAGHLQAGEAVAEGVREAKEELGVDVQSETIHFLGWRVEVADQDNGQRNREHQAVHMTLLKNELNVFVPDPSEVYGLVSVPVEAGLQLHDNQVRELTCKALIYEPHKKQWHSTHETITSERFVPRIQPYYRTVHIMAERLLEGRFPLSI